MQYLHTGTEFLGVTIAQNWAHTSQSGLSVAIFPEKVREGSSLEQVMSYHNRDVVAKIAFELGIEPEDAVALFEDLKQFLWLAAVTDHSVIPSPIIDEAWHRFILFTQDYADFCEKHFGGFLQHAPQRVGDRRLVPEDLHPTIQAIHAEFDGLPSDNWHYIPAQDVLAA